VIPFKDISALAAITKTPLIVLFEEYLPLVSLKSSNTDFIHSVIGLIACFTKLPVIISTILLITF